MLSLWRVQRGPRHDCIIGHAQTRRTFKRQLTSLCLRIIIFALCYNHRIIMISVHLSDLFVSSLEPVSIADYAWPCPHHLCHWAPLSSHRGTLNPASDIYCLGTFFSYLILLNIMFHCLQPAASVTRRMVQFLFISIPTPLLTPSHPPALLFDTSWTDLQGYFISWGTSSLLSGIIWSYKKLKKQIKNAEQMHVEWEAPLADLVGKVPPETPFLLSLLASCFHFNLSSRHCIHHLHS